LLTYIDRRGFGGAPKCEFNRFSWEIFQYLLSQFGKINELKDEKISQEHKKKQLNNLHKMEENYE
jgi:hypothetical protein